jgi:tetratricopeptide (TPR) repeat protein
MVLPAPPAHASLVEAHWLDRLVLAIELSARGVLTLVDGAVPARLREAYLRLRARDPATDVIVDVRRLDELPLGSTAILALKPPIGEGSLDWLNLNRPVLSERRLNVVLWCEDDAAAALAWRAPDFFDWITSRVDCPPAPAAHAVAEVKRAVRACACGIAWDGPGLEETLAMVRPGRPIRRVAVASYQSMIDALTSRGPGWLYLEGIDTAFHLRRLRWAMAEAGRRMIVFRRAFEQTAPGWWTVHARHRSIAEAVNSLTAVGGTGRLAALTGLDPDACACARFALRRGIVAERLEELLATGSDPRAVLQDIAQQSGWTAAEVIAQDDPRLELAATRPALEREAARHEHDRDPIVLVLRGQLLGPEQWADLGARAEGAGDFEVAIRWMNAGLGSLPDDASPQHLASLHVRRARIHHRAGDVGSASADLERADHLARGAVFASMIAESAIPTAYALMEHGESLRAREQLEMAVHRSAEIGFEADEAELLEVLASVLVKEGDLAGARLRLERALSIKRRLFTTEDHPEIAATLSALGGVLVRQGDVAGASRYLERSLAIRERFGGPEHPAVAAVLRRLAELDQIMKDMGSARARLERALFILRVTLGRDEHPDIAETLVELARVYAAGGDLDGAQAMLERALAIQQAVFGVDGQLAGATTRRELAGVLVARGDLTGAVVHLEHALATLRRIFERDDHPDIASMLRELERLQKLQGELQRS